jgi:spore photoproduct lyase
MLSKIIETAKKYEDDKVFEIGSNSDLILENTITNNLVWTIENFRDSPKGKLTFPTKFDMVDPILNMNHQRRVIVRVSLNPDEIIQMVEFGTSRFKNRIEAINKLAEAEYDVGVLIAPIILVEQWKNLYQKMFQEMKERLNKKAQDSIFFEFIFMTYSYIHKMINQEAFPNAIELYHKELMTVREKGKYTYHQAARQEGELFFREMMNRYFPQNKILYFS